MQSSTPFWRSVVAHAAIACLCASPASVTRAPSQLSPHGLARRPELRVLVPAYFYPVPGSPWQRLTAAAAAHPGRVAAIGDPFNGPGPTFDPSYAAAFQSFRAAGGKLFGYVYTSYGARPLATVEQDMLTWLAWYPIDGFFVDEMDVVPGAHEAYYQALTQFARAQLPNAVVVANPGVNTVPSYLEYNGAPVASTLCIFEHSANALGWSASPWVASKPRTAFYALPYGLAASQWTAAVEHAFAQNCGWVYATDDVLPNPWDTLPSWFESLVAYVDAQH